MKNYLPYGCKWIVFMDLSLCDTVFVLWHVLHPWHSSMGDLLSEATNKLN
jgi:hypothetical protein